MRALLPVACVAGFGMFVRYAWRDVHDAISKVTGGPPPYLVPQPVVYRPPAVEEEPIEDDRVMEPGEVLPPPSRAPRRNQYTDPRTPPPTYVHPAERVMQVP